MPEVGEGISKAEVVELKIKQGDKINE